MAGTRQRKHPQRRKGDQNPSLQFRSLLLLNGYRLAIAILLFSFNFIHLKTFAQQENTKIFFALSTFYLVYSAGAWILSRQNLVSLKNQVHINALVDVLSIAWFTLISGGVSSGWGTLIIAPIAGAALLLPGKTALLFAAYGTVALIFQEFYGAVSGFIQNTAFTQAGLLGIALFATAILAITLAKRASESAALAEKRGIDLANLAQLNEHLINRIDSGIIVVDEDSSVKLMNRAAAELLELPKSTNQISLAQASDGLFNIHQEWTNSEVTGNDKNSFSMERDNQSPVRIRITKVGSRSEDRGSVIYLSDTSEINRQVQDSKLASLGRLTASIAHEIRNPLGAISHAAQLLEESDSLNDDNKRLADIIHVQSNRLNEVIQNVLRLSRKDNPSQESIGLSSWLDQFVCEFGEVHSLKAGWSRIEINPKALAVFFDINHLHQILWNLCGNAIKYATAHESMPKIIMQGYADDSTRTKYLDIIDSGPGISVADRDKLFEPFYTTSSTGTGLGLYISRELCLSNGGELTYIAVPSGGSCFRIRFPRHPDRTN